MSVAPSNTESIFNGHFQANVDIAACEMNSSTGALVGVLWKLRAAPKLD